MSADSHAAHYRPDTDGLRAIAVVSVVLHHAFPEQLSGGFVGVDIFFVLSGYLISSIILSGLQKQKFSFIDFYARRIKRIFPALFLVLTTVLVTGWFQLLPVDYKQVGKHAVAGSAFISNFAFWGEEGYFDAASANKPLLHLWSLAIGEQFYMLWPLTLWAAYRWRMNPMRWIAIILVASFLLNLYLVREHITAAFYNPASRFWELLIGALLAAMHVRQVGLGTLIRDHFWQAPSASRITTTGQANAMAWGGVALLVSVLLTIKPESAFPGWWALFPTLGTVLLIAAGPSAWFNRHVLSSKPFVGVGLISYPLYLWHWPLLSFSHIEAAGEPQWKIQAGWVLLATALAWMTYQFVEKPIRFGHLNRKTITATLCAAMCVAAGSGYATYRNDGFDQRFPELVRNLMSKGGRPAIVEGWRDKECMLDFRLQPSAYKDFCVEKKRPLIFIWGDSHAGSLYPGFKALQESGRYKFGLGERTAAICPSVLGIEPRPLCKALNDSNIQAIRYAKPDVVILYSWWHNKRYDLRNLEATVEEIKKAGVPRIIMLGAVPYWRKHLPQILLEEWKKGAVQTSPPLRLGEEFLDPEVRIATDAMRTRAQKMGIEFISGMDFFCNAQGCMTRMSEDSTQPLSYDYGHLSTGAMVHYIEQLAPLIFKNAP